MQKLFLFLVIQVQSAVVVLCFSSFLLPGVGFARQADFSEARSVLKDFFSLHTLTGDFTQIDSKGKHTKGIFYLQRPGKIRFVYKNAPLTVIADGKNVAVENRVLGAWSLYQLNQTALKLLLSNDYTPSFMSLNTVQSNQTIICLILRDKALGRGYISLLFDRMTHALLQWTIVDQQNLRTIVKIDHVRTGVAFTPDVFQIPYQKIRRQAR